MFILMLMYSYTLILLYSYTPILLLIPYFAFNNGCKSKSQVGKNGSLLFGTFLHSLNWSGLQAHG